ncbi:multidrug effflux MFS transporter [Viridibacterium curvum]|uniref:Bcr/CflA family efflux transporter n=1 Tax=Viridibacterium curvum TaxID=1101404 RepID=A0ABP9QR71_9RHOO
MKIPYPLLAVILAALNAIGPFSIDTYLPAFPAIESGLVTTTLSVQQSLTAYMLPFSIMMLWHGALSDALGRRRVILVGMSCYLVASLLCAFAQNIEMLWLGRALQGLSAGSGVIVGRAIVRDLLDGPAAQRLMSHVALVFAIAPGVAPIIGGALAQAWGWRAIFALLALMAAALMVLVWTQLPETLPQDKRQSLHPASLLKAYSSVLGDHRFVLLSLAMASLFGGFFLYVMSAPVFLMQHLHLDATQFGWLFVPLVLGMMGGSMLSARLAGRLSPIATVKLGYTIAAAATLLNLVLSAAMPDTLSMRIPQLALYTLGMSAAMPTLTLHALDMFPARRGLAASCQGAIQTLVMAFAAGVIAPLVWGTTLHLALAGAASLLLSTLACWWSMRS